ncbi:MAG: hypothetical protein FWD71_14635 [Oscillospiraceae bacterium]|nr:hypothetical protein [Oscillospiraceae bacterium]
MDIMKFFQAIKKFFVENPDSEQQHDDIMIYDNIIMPECQPTTEEIPPLLAYETRKKEIAESTEPIDGVFYFYDDKIIFDFYSECLRSDRENPCRQHMYHVHFYQNYMQRKFDGLIYGENSIPRGRVYYNILYIDYCYARNAEIIEQIKRTYRMTGEITVKTNNDYRCDTCRHITT